MKKIIRIFMIAALAGVLAVGCSNMIEQLKVSDQPETLDFTLDFNLADDVGVSRDTAQ